MDFLHWWFDTHWILSTLVTPAWTFLWCIWSGDQGWRPTLIVVWYMFLVSRWVKTWWNDE